jgi:hypothetical protein
MADERTHEVISTEGQDRFATTQDEARLSGESAPPPLTEESGTPRFAKGHAPAEHQASTHTLTEEEREERASAEAGAHPSRGTVPPAPPPTT